MADSAGARFAGFSSEAFEWFDGLERENSKVWFAAQRPIYDGAVRGPFQAMLEQLAAELGGAVRIARQHRDLRFSADKSPYQTGVYGVIGDRPGGAAPLYAELAHAGLFAGTGYYELARDQLARFRDAVRDERSGPELEAAMAALHAAGIETWGETLRTAPRGHPRDHPRIVLLRHTALIAGARLSAGERGIGRDAALEHARTVWRTAAALTAWLDTHVGPSHAPPVSRYGGRGR